LGTQIFFLSIILFIIIIPYLLVSRIYQNIFQDSVSCKSNPVSDLIPDIRCIPSYHCLTCSVADPGCFIPDPDSNIAHAGSRILNFFIPNPGSYLKSWMQIYFFRASYGCSLHMYLFSLSHSQKDSRSGIRKKYILDLDSGSKG
jgi:hypothetical protein